jgi:hypothetical protein
MDPGGAVRAACCWELLGGLGMRCTRCSKGSFIEIRMHVAGEDLTFRRCGRCENQMWEGVDGPMPLTTVLELARAM